MSSKPTHVAYVVTAPHEKVARVVAATIVGL